MPVRAIELPPESGLHDVYRPGDFIDCYFNDTVPGDISPTRAAILALTRMPVWAKILLKIRNFIVSFFGLKTGNGSSDLPQKDRPVVGDTIGFFRIHSITKDEILVGENDKHLDFLISVLRHEEGYSLATWVRTHNRFGRAYLWVIMPFHKLIVRGAVSSLSFPES